MKLIQARKMRNKIAFPKKHAGEMVSGQNRTLTGEAFRITQGCERAPHISTRTCEHSKALRKGGDVHFLGTVEK